MKIALIRSAVHRTGGVERYVWLLAREMARRGHEVSLLARRCPELPGPSVRFRRIQARGPFSFLKVLSFARGVRALLREEEFDVVHSCDRIFDCDIYRAGEGLHREWLLVSKRYLSPLKAALRWFDPLHHLLCRIEKRLIKDGGARRVTAIGQKGAEEIRRHFGLENIPVIYNGVDPDEFRPPEEGEREKIRGRLGVPREAFMVLFVGSGYFRKGLWFLIEAFSRLGNGGPGTPWLVVAGKGTMGPYRRLARSLGVNRRTLFCGAIDPAGEIYRAADVFVFPTLYEPFGNVCLEALASGLPCVFSSRCGGAEIVTDGENGFVLDDPADVHEMSRQIRTCMDEKRAVALGKAARELALRFSVSANVDVTESLYREIVSEKTAGTFRPLALTKIL